MCGFFKKKDDYSEKIERIEIDRISLNPSQPRQSINPDELLRLSQSIKENGLLQPITVRKTESGYELIAGERRLRACALAGYTEIAAIVTDKTQEQSAVLAIIENIQRSGLNCVEEALAIKRLIDHFGLTQEELAGRLSMAQSTVANKLRILKLPEKIRLLIASYGFSERQARALLKLPEDLLETAVETIRKRQYNVSDTERYIETLLTPKKASKPAVFFKEKRLYINSINKTLDIMKKSGIEFTSRKREENGYLEYLIRIPHD